MSRATSTTASCCAVQCRRQLRSFADLARQRTLFDDVPSDAAIVFVPVDFTLPEDGWTPADYGHEALVAALQSVAPTAVVSALTNLTGSAATRGGPRTRISSDMRQRPAPPTCGPLRASRRCLRSKPRLIHTLGAIYGIVWDQVRWPNSQARSAPPRSSASLPLGARELAKLVPVYGQTAGARTAAGMSFRPLRTRQGRIYFLARRKAGASDPSGVAKAYKDALGSAFGGWRASGASEPAEPKEPLRLQPRQTRALSLPARRDADHRAGATR